MGTVTERFKKNGKPSYTAQLRKKKKRQGHPQFGGDIPVPKSRRKLAQEPGKSTQKARSARSSGQCKETKGCVGMCPRLHRILS